LSVFAGIMMTFHPDQFYNNAPWAKSYTTKWYTTLNGVATLPMVTEYQYHQTPESDISVKLPSNTTAPNASPNDLGDETFVMANADKDDDSDRPDAPSSHSRSSTTTKPSTGAFTITRSEHEWTVTEAPHASPGPNTIVPNATTFDPPDSLPHAPPPQTAAVPGKESSSLSAVTHLPGAISPKLTDDEAPAVNALFGELLERVESPEFLQRIFDCFTMDEIVVLLHIVFAWIRKHWSKVPDAASTVTESMVGPAHESFVTICERIEASQHFLDGFTAVASKEKMEGLLHSAFAWIRNNKSHLPLHASKAPVSSASPHTTAEAQAVFHVLYHNIESTACVAQFVENADREMQEAVLNVALSWIREHKSQDCKRASSYMSSAVSNEAATSELESLKKQLEILQAHPNETIAQQTKHIETLYASNRELIRQLDETEAYRRHLVYELLPRENKRAHLLGAQTRDAQVQQLYDHIRMLAKKSADDVAYIRRLQEDMKEEALQEPVASGPSHPLPPSVLRQRKRTRKAQVKAEANVPWNTPMGDFCTVTMMMLFIVCALLLVRDVRSFLSR
jgi:hypothetical protein